jgi:hypothetical protein
MTYEPIDTYVPGAPGAAVVPVLVGQREQAARAYAASAGWHVHVCHVPPAPGQPEGFVVGHRPPAGAMAPAGSVLLVDVTRRVAATQRYGRGLLAGGAAALAVATAGVTWSWSEARDERRPLVVEDVVDAPVEVPVGETVAAADWTGWPLADVRDVALRYGLVLVVETVEGERVDRIGGPVLDPDAARVVLQAPRPGVVLVPGSVVVVTVDGSLGG